MKIEETEIHVGATNNCLLLKPRLKRASAQAAIFKGRVQSRSIVSVKQLLLSC